MKDNDDFHLEIGRRLDEMRAPRRRRERRKAILLWLLGGVLFFAIFALCLGVGKPVVDFIHETWEEIFPAKKIEPQVDK